LKSYSIPAQILYIPQQKPKFNFKHGKSALVLKMMAGKVEWHSHRLTQSKAEQFQHSKQNN